MQLSDAEKLILIMLADIHEKVGIKDSIDPKLVKDMIFSGNAWALKIKHSGVFEEEVESCERRACSSI